MPAKLIIVIGHSALDRVYRIAAFPPSPTKVRALEHIECGGGTAANAAAAIARLGGNVQLWSRVGNDDTGKGIRQSLKASGVDTEFLLEHEGSRTSTSVIIVDGQGRHLVVSERDHAMPAKIDWLPLENILSAGAILSDMTWREATLAVFRQARSLGIPTVLDLDVAGALPSEEIFEVTDYGICSEAALERFVDGQDLRERLASLISKGIRHAGVTLGEGGYTWLRRGGVLRHQPAYHSGVVDTTGAGDAFHGSFAWALACGMEDAECARIAAAVSALKCRRLGARAGVPRVDELDTFLTSATGRGLSL